MIGKLRIGLIAGALGIAAAMLASHAPEAKAQRDRVEPSAWEYKVGILSYNPGERLTDEQRAAQFEKALNLEARQGWEPVGSLLSRNVVQTVGGGVTTRESTSFVAYRRPKK